MNINWYRTVFMMGLVSSIEQVKKTANTIPLIVKIFNMYIKCSTLSLFYKNGIVCSKSIYVYM